MRNIFRVIPVLAVIAFAGVFAASASACSCLGPQPGKERQFYRDAIRSADAAVTAKLIRRNGKIDDFSEPPGKVRLVYRVKRAHKKLDRFPRGRKLKVWTTNQSAACGIGSRPGSVDGLLLYRFRADGRKYWGGSLCGMAPPRELRKAARTKGGGSSAQGRSSLTRGPAGPLCRSSKSSRSAA